MTCNHCKLEIKRTHNAQKYHPKCAVEVYKIQLKEWHDNITPKSPMVEDGFNAREFFFAWDEEGVLL